MYATNGLNISCCILRFHVNVSLKKCYAAYGMSMTAWHIRIHVVCERIDVTVYDVHEEWLKKRWCALHFSIFGWKMTIYIPTSGQRHFYYSCTHVIISSGVAITCLDTFFFFYVELIFAKLNKFCSSSNEFDFSDEIYVGEHLQCRTQCRRTQ